MLDRAKDTPPSALPFGTARLVGRRCTPAFRRARTGRSFISEAMTAEEVRLALIRVKQDLGRFGVLPVTDPTAPSLVSIVAGVPVTGSWWGHPAGQLIYQVGESLDTDSGVLTVRLWRGKLTLVHRRLWPALVRIGGARSEWQMDGLSAVAQQLLTRIEREKTLRSDRLPPDFLAGSQSFRPALRDLEQRLLVLTRSLHTSTGSHALEAESWAAWSATSRTPRFPGSVVSAQLAIERAAARLSSKTEPRRWFPWGRFPAKTRISRRRQ